MAGRYLQGAEQVCIVLLTGIGDVVHGLPVAVGIKRAHPGVKITWVAEPPGAQLVGGHPSVDDVIVFQKSAGWFGIEGPTTSVRGSTVRSDAQYAALREEPLAHGTVRRAGPDRPGPGASA